MAPVFVKIDFFGDVVVVQVFVVEAKSKSCTDAVKEDEIYIVGVAPLTFISLDDELLFVWFIFIDSFSDFHFFSFADN